jgi:signal transduction histidine kinase
MALISCLSFIPHLFTFWYQGPEAYYSELSEILFYFAAGLVIGMISSRENRLRTRYQRLSEQLTVSYQRLQDQANQLVQAESELGRARKLSFLGHISASLAHEIKNPLAAIKGAAEILADEVDKDHPKHEFVQIMTDEISRLNHSVEEVLAYCRGQENEAPDDKAPLGRVLDQVIQVMRPGLTEKSINLDLDQDSGANNYQIQGAALTQVMINLVLNAVEAVDHEGRIRIKAAVTAKGLEIQVGDDGPGIDPEEHERIFQSFVTFKKQGTGLGLSITQKIIQRLGGSILVDTSEYGGALFSICLPVSKTPVSKEV